MAKFQVSAVVTPRLVRIFLFASIDAMNFGYDNNWWSGVIMMQSFIQDYGYDDGSGNPRTLPSRWLSTASGTPIGGWIIDCAVAGLLTRRFSRRSTIYVICGVALVGMVLRPPYPTIGFS